MIFFVLLTFSIFISRIWPSDYAVVFDEDTAPGTSLVNVTAFSEAPPITYRLAPGQDEILGQLFAIGSTSGNLILRRRFTTDTSNSNEYNMIVTAQDFSNAAAVARVKVCNL